MDSTLVSNLRSAVNNDSPNYDEVMDYYYDKMNPGSTRYEEGDEDDWRDNRASYEPINKAYGYANNAFLGVIDEDLEYVGQDTTYLNYAKRFLLDPDFPTLVPGEYYLHPDSLWYYVSQNDINGSTMGSLLFNTAFNVDMLWYYVDDDSTRVKLYNKLDNIAYAVYNFLHDPLTDNLTALWNVPDSLQVTYGGQTQLHLLVYMHNIRIFLTSALGYAGCVLQNADYVQFAEDDLFDAQHIPNFPVNGGFFNLMLSESGIYNEGMDYTNFTLGYLADFFTARKRVNIPGLAYKDWFENSTVKELYRKSLYLHAPDFSYLPVDDAYIKYVCSNGVLTQPYAFQEMLGYCYQGSDEDIKNYMKWLIKGYTEKYGNILPPDKGARKEKLYYFNSDSSPMGDPAATPLSLQTAQCNEEDSEFTIFRKKLNSGDITTDLETYLNSPTLFVNHEHSGGWGFHEDSDQSGFQLYYKG
ncbi:MAG: hypothetical protein K8R35_06915, partial [Bacteroidales bacterium]|nr:hypothetical protein [Bacteroidales bacterium]